MASNTLVFILVGLTVLFLCLIGIVWMYRGSEQSIELLKPIFSGLGLAFFSLIGVLLYSSPAIKYKTDILVISKNKGETVPFEYLIALNKPPKISSGYIHINNETLAYRHKLSEEEKNYLSIYDSKYYLELVEWSTFTWMAQNYPHWQAERDWFEGLSGGGGSIQVFKDASKETEKIDIKVLLKGNRFADRRDNNDKIYVSLPKGTKMEHKTINDSFHKVVLDNDYLKVEISFMLVGGGELGASILAQKIRQNAKGSLYRHNISVKFNTRLKRLPRGTILSKQQKNWIEDFCTFYNESFSWGIFREKLERYL